MISKIICLAIGFVLGVVTMMVAWVIYEEGDDE